MIEDVGGAQVEESVVVLNEEEQQQVINININININDDFDISLVLFEDNELFSDLFSTPDDDDPSSSSLDNHQSQSQSQSSSSLSDPESMSSLFRDIEHKLLNDDDDEEQQHQLEDHNFINQNQTSQEECGYNDYLSADEFLSDLQLPISSLLDPPQSDSSPSDQDISMDDLLLDVPLLNTDYSPSHSSSEQVVITMEAPVLIPETSTPESQVSFQDDDEDNQNEQELEQEKISFDVSQDKEKTRTTTDSAALEDKEDDDPITKKRKRQMRNRDAAVRSRERKKMYVKDLEVKSKYLEGECIRLQRLLQCCAAENHALHLQLQEKVYSASRTKQESAVLFMESLLLGSLLWFLGILAILGLLSPEMLRVQLPANLLVSAENQKVVDLVALGRAKSKSIGLGTLRLFFKSKRCSSRSKMKIMICNAAVAA